MNLMTKFPENFFVEEDRAGYTVSSKMKKVWAVQLDILREIDQVFSNHNIRWWVLGGSLLGAIRHKGYIPWDDDIDIVVPRTDYNRLREIGPRCFRKPFFYQDEFTEPGIMYGHAKIRNVDTTMITEKYIINDDGSCAFCHGIFVDIFPLDKVPDSAQEKKEWIDNVKTVAVPAWRLRKYSHRHIPSNDEKMEAQLALLDEIRRPNLLFELYENQLGKYAECRTQKSCIYGLWRKDSRWIFDNSCFENTERVPFEFMNVPIPTGYEAILTQLYGEWRVMRQERSMHSEINGSFYDPEHSYLNYVDKVKGVNKEKLIELMNQ